jgi:surface antigen
MRIIKIFILIAISLFLTNCANRSHTGAVLGATTGTTICLQYISDNPYLIATCAVGAAFAGAEILYKGDQDVHNAVFVDHLNTSGYGSSYTNWYNEISGNGGIIHITKSYTVGPIKCKDYDHTVDITNQWPLIGIGGVNRKVVFGTACQLPDGQWIEKPVGVN